MQTIKFKIVAFLLIGILISSCSKNASKESIALDEVAVTENYEAVESKIEQAEQPKSDLYKEIKLIKSANVRYKVKNVKDATKKVSFMVRKFNGYVADQRFQNTNYNIENRFMVKVPSQQFDVLLDSLSSVAEFIEYENITSKDVTEEYVDIEARLKTKQEIKKRYEDILRRRAVKVEDILEAEAKIGAIQVEIEAAKGRLKYLSSKVSFSTIQVDLYETVNYKEQPKEYKRTFFSKVKEGLSFGLNLVESIFLGIIYLWPLIIVVTIIIIWIKRRRKKK